VNPNCSRKSFFAKLGAFVAAIGTLPKVLAKPETRAVAPTVPTDIALRPEQRAVPRQEGTF
jgi:energy-coupling factor transporter ATP-binding protein EcfA2